MNNNISKIISTVKDFHAKASTAARKQEENRKTFTKELADTKNQELRAEILAMKDQAVMAIKDSADAAEQEIKADNALQGKDLTDDVKLLSAGIKLDTADLQALADRNAGNETMLRAIKDYAAREEVVVELPPMAKDKLQAVGKIRTGALNLVESIATSPTDVIVSASVSEFGTTPVFNIV